MPTYKYKFCDGTVSEVEVSDQHYALLKEMDKQEKQNDRNQEQRNVSLKALLKKDKGNDKDGVNER